MAGKEADGGLRSYASMTYAGLKSMIYAGLGHDDPRVKAALSYIKRHYTLDENPGLGQQGLYYYYHTFAKTMFVLGEPTITDAAGNTHDWRAELVAALANRQQARGRLGQPRRPIHGRRPQPGDGIRSAGAGLRSRKRQVTTFPKAAMLSQSPDETRSGYALSSRSMRNFIWPSSSPTYSLCGQGQLTGSSSKRGMMCQWQ